jgi:hypothetical protein
LRHILSAEAECFSYNLGYIAMVINKPKPQGQRNQKHRAKGILFILSESIKDMLGKKYTIRHQA